MPYEVWSVKLTRLLSIWYKQLVDSGYDYDSVADQLGIEPPFWDIVGRLRNPLLKQAFHELTFYQRVWILKSLCDNCMVS